MPKIYKCPICGCTEYYEIPGVGQESRITTGGPYSDNPHKTTIIQPRCLIQYEIDIWGDARISKNVFSFNANVCLCKNCGHMDLFNENMLKSIKAAEEEFSEQIKAKENEIKELNLKEKELLKELDDIKNRTKKISELLGDENITVKQQRELQEESKELNSNRASLEKEVNQIQPKISKLNEELAELKDRVLKVASQSSIEIKPGIC